MVNGDLRLEACSSNFKFSIPYLELKHELALRITCALQVHFQSPQVVKIRDSVFVLIQEAMIVSVSFSVCKQTQKKKNLRRIKGTLTLLGKYKIKASNCLGDHKAIHRTYIRSITIFLNI